MGCWLVVEPYPSEKNMNINWDDDLSNMNGKIKHVPVTTNQLWDLSMSSRRDFTSRFRLVCSLKTGSKVCSKLFRGKTVSSSTSSPSKYYLDGFRGKRHLMGAAVFAEKIPRQTSFQDLFSRSWRCLTCRYQKPQVSGGISKYQKSCGLSDNLFDIWYSFHLTWISMAIELSGHFAS